MASDNDRPATALIDYVAIVIGPILIMFMAGSLVFFLIDALYQGNYPERLSYTMFFFVFAAVLIARIGIQVGRGRSFLYVLALGGAVFLAMQAFVQYPKGLLQAIGPIISIALIALVAWAADKLTWDCTHLDGERSAGGQGLLAATGLNATETPPVDEVDEEPKKKKKPSAEGMLGWVDRWNAYRELQKKKPHTPGTWVIYFGLAALPIFIVGQSLIPASEGGRRRWAFLEMAMFVGSGLGLLVTTSLLGLKKYLQDRGARIPGAMTASWLGLGLILIVSFVTIASVLPRPYSETPLVQLSTGQKHDRNASKYAVVKGKEGGKGEGAKGNKTEAGDGKSTAKGGQPGGKGQSGEAKKGSGDQQGQNGSNSNQKGNDQGNSKQQGNDQKGNDQKGNDQKGSDQKGNEQKGSEQKGNDQKSADSQGDSAEKPENSDESNDGNSDGGSSESKIGEMFEKLGEGVKWIMWVVIAIAVIVGIVIFFLKFLSPFTAWARNLLDWLKSLFGRKERAAGEGGDEAEADDERERLPSFDSFSNPFSDGTARDRSLPDLIRYTYRALESWAADQEQDCLPGETPREFAVRLQTEQPQLESVERFSQLVTRLAYSPRPLPADALQTLKSTWSELDRFAVVSK